MKGVVCLCAVVLLLCCFYETSWALDRSQHRFYSPNLGPDNVTQHSGLITVNGTYGDNLLVLSKLTHTL